MPRAYIVTVKFPIERVHLGKTLGRCPADVLQICSDVEGQHHSTILYGDSTDEIMLIARLHQWHVTRIESVIDRKIIVETCND